LHLALTLLPIGAFTRQHADELAKVINIVFVDAGVQSASYGAAAKAGEVLTAMFTRVKEGKSWNVTSDERRALTEAIVVIDKHVRTMTTVKVIEAARNVDALNREATAKGFGFLDRVPVVRRGAK
jgi:hypothetical protein